MDQELTRSQIKKSTLNFMAIAWLTIVWHRLCPTYGDNVLIPDRATLIVGIMEGYELNVAQLIFR